MVVWHCYPTLLASDGLPRTNNWLKCKPDVRQPWWIFKHISFIHSKLCLQVNYSLRGSSLDEGMVAANRDKYELQNICIQEKTFDKQHSWYFLHIVAFTRWADTYFDESYSIHHHKFGVVYGVTFIKITFMIFATSVEQALCEQTCAIEIDSFIGLGIVWTDSRTMKISG